MCVVSLNLEWDALKCHKLWISGTIYSFSESLAGVEQQQRLTPAQGKIKQVLRLGDTSVAAPLVFGHSGRGERRTTMAGQNKSPARGETARG